MVTEHDRDERQRIDGIRTQLANLIPNWRHVAVDTDREILSGLSQIDSYVFIVRPDSSQQFGSAVVLKQQRDLVRSVLGERNV